ncbi:sulfurtransferase TusA family protein [Aggregicoccus sp. 17bor-14]|uniref:sulfurtransferase TusA family protein n=1 Tax=Myxococcaceae TaxID=31 RepID=UPI00129C5BFE|nr:MULTISPECIES: sulfurtransferase TusA family protein [Myxococcaceae]MBF5041117.1 sulfurtransferase TusA family protein [Simulacricoccus sp. 17bor-14]MRI86904.1 sulfurtransferase TusA family protein [Aggregicoccus sp. 17bor-14]
MPQSPAPPAAVLLDTSGRYCPVPILEIAKACRGLPAGTLVELWATDPGIRADLPAWCEATGHRLLGLEQQGERFVARVLTQGRAP